MAGRLKFASGVAPVKGALVVAKEAVVYWLLLLLLLLQVLGWRGFGRTWISPCACVEGDGAHEGCEVELFVRVVV